MSTGSRKPNLFIIGAAKSGTTSLHRYLARHPEIFMSEPKEPGFFTPEIGYYPNDEAWYLGLFEGAAGARYAGEASTHYTKLPVYGGVPERIAAFVDAPPRFIYLMRDPVDRAVSHYWHALRKFEEHLPIDRAMRERPDYTAFSDYGRQLRPYFEHFGRDSVITVTFEALVQRPRETVESILLQLELEPTLPAASFRKHNARPDSFEQVRGRGLLERFSRSGPWELLSPWTPDWLKAIGRKLKRRPADATDQPVERVIRELRPAMAQHVRELESLLDRSFPEWTLTLEGTSVGEAE